MTRTNASGLVVAWLAGVAGLGLGGCAIDAGEGIGTALGRGIACAFDFDLGKRISSDERALQGSLRCEDTSSCSERRTLMSGVELELSVDVTGHPPESVSVATDTPGTLELDGFETEADFCRQGSNTQVAGHLRFTGLGEASLIVMNEGEELDRFVWSVQEAASLSLGAERLTEEGPVDLGEVEELELGVGETALLRARVFDQAGFRLITPPRFEWTFDGTPPSGPSGSGTLLMPDRPGEIEIEVKLDDLMQRVKVVVSGASSS